MDLVKLPELIKKYKYVAAVVLLGIALMLLPARPEEAQEVRESQPGSEEKEDINSRLAEILCKIEGAGKVEVMLTVASGEETVYQTNEAFSAGQDSSSTTVDTVTVTDSGRNETGLVRQVNPQTYLGAVIVCQGADNPKVRLAIVEAVSNITGLRTDKISVLKMK